MWYNLLEAFTLVIAEKTDAARKIAFALGKKEVVTRSSGTFEIPVAFDGNSYVVCSALGHLFEVGDPELDRSVFPIFDVDWFGKERKTTRAGWRKNTRFQTLIRNRVAIITSYAKRAKRFVNACDYDIEGEIIGSNILQFACSNQQSLRAKFSTLTEDEIRAAFSTLEQSGGYLAKAGRLRHEVDFLWGINLSRVLTRAANNGGVQFSNVTIGRVQGPALAFVVDREIEKRAHIPLPCWYLECTLKKSDFTFQAKYKRSPIHILSLAEAVFEAISDSQYATVTLIQKFKTTLPPRYPFDLGELQREAFYNYGMTPRATLGIAEKLYLRALISYPRTESQKLPQSIHPEEILRRLAKNLNYSNNIETLLADTSRRRFPWQGPREDPAHPAIYPTGELPNKLTEDERKIYDLITRRFCNTFAPDAIIEKTKASFDISTNEFSAEWENVVIEGWMKYYPFRKASSVSLPIELETGEKLRIDAKSKVEKYTQAPPRYNEGSLLSKMESEGIGTKATRADTISTLIDRKYIRKSRDLAPEENALILVNQLRKHCPMIISTEMTRSLENKLELLQKEQEREEYVIIEELNNIRVSLRNLLEMDDLDWQTNVSSLQAKNLPLGRCPKCKTGNLQAIRSIRTRKRFIRCTNYEDGCKTSSPLPAHGVIKTTSNCCDSCGWPMIILRSRASASQKCSNYFCIASKKT